MKKTIITILLAITFMTNISYVSAASKCDVFEQVELNDLVANVKVNYEETIEALAESDYNPTSDPEIEAQTLYKTYFKISIYNITEDIYVKVTNDINKEVKYFYYKDVVDGVASFDWTDLSKVANFTFNVYSSESTNCKDEIYRVINFTTPRYNSFSNQILCDDEDSFFLCQKYLETSVEYSETEFKTSFTAYKAEQEKKEANADEAGWFASLINFIKEHKVAFIIGAVSIVAIGGVVTVVILGKKRSKEL